MKAEQSRTDTGHLAHVLNTGPEQRRALPRPPAVGRLLPPAAGPGPGPRPRPPARPSTARTLPQRLTGDKRAACHGRWGHGRRGPARSQEGVSNRAGEGRACGLALPRGQGSPRP